MKTSLLAASLLALAPTLAFAQAQPDQDRKVAGGGITVPGWMGKIDARAAASGQSINDAKLERQGDALHVVTGPAATYWNPANRATGTYTVRATFREPEFMALNNHAHPYGIVVAGAAMDSAEPRYLYCAAYGNGRFIMRGFGPEPFQLNGRGEEHAAISKASDKGQPVTQEIAVTVHADRVDCAINGQVVGSYPKSQVVGEGRLATTDGIYGIRIGHNAEATISGLTMTVIR